MEGEPLGTWLGVQRAKTKGRAQQLEARQQQQLALPPSAFRSPTAPTCPATVQVTSIVGTLLEVLNTPSESVQRGVSDCLPALMQMLQVSTQAAGWVRLRAPAGLPLPVLKTRACMTSRAPQALVLCVPALLLIHACVLDVAQFAVLLCMFLCHMRPVCHTPYCSVRGFQ